MGQGSGVRVGQDLRVRLPLRRLGLLPLLHKVHEDRRGGKHGPGHLVGATQGVGGRPTAHDRDPPAYPRGTLLATTDK